MLRLAELSSLAIFGAALTTDSSAAAIAATSVPAYTTEPSFITTLQATKGMDQGVRSWFGSDENCQDANGLIMANGNDGKNPFLRWNFYKDGIYYRIENEGLRRMGCNDNAWLRANTKCHDRDVRREANDHHESKWSVEPTGSGTFRLKSYWKDLNCKDKYMSTTSAGDDFVFTFNAGDGRQEWAFDAPVLAAEKEITKIEGDWHLFASGSGALKASLKRTVADSQGKTMSQSSADEVSVSVNAAVEFKIWPGTAKVELEVGFSSTSTEASEVSTQLTNAEESTCTVTCDAVEGKRAHLYQWNKKAISATDSLSMSTCHYICIYDA